MLAHFGIATHQFDRERYFRNASAGAVVVKTGIEYRSGFAHRELEIAATGSDLLLRYSACILAAIAAAGFLQSVCACRHVNGIGPYDILGNITSAAATAA
jgi:hypothetical protein